MILAAPQFTARSALKGNPRHRAGPRGSLRESGVPSSPVSFFRFPHQACAGSCVLRADGRERHGQPTIALESKREGIISQKFTRNLCAKVLRMAHVSNGATVVGTNTDSARPHPGRRRPVQTPGDAGSRAAPSVAA